jgi:acetophenone carboxylase
MRTMRICVIFNPAARGEKARQFREHLATISAECVLKPTGAPGAGHALAAEAAREGFETVVAAGGDGTVNEVLNGIGEEPGAFQRVRLAVLPLGTINVFARELKIPPDFFQAWQVIRKGCETTIDLPKAEFSAKGEACQRFFAQTFLEMSGKMLAGGLCSCCMTLTKDGDHLLVDFTGTGPETPSSYNAHPQAAIGHFANYVYEYLFHDLPISNGTFAPIDFKFEPGSCLYPDVRAATSNSVMIATGVMSAVHNTFARAVFSTEHWRQAGASQGNGGNAVVLAGMSQWNSPFADMLAYSINTEGQGALPEMDGMNAFGFPWCPAGRAPDVELVENEFPLFIPISSHWKDSAGHGKQRGGVGTAQLWVAHHVPWVVMMAIADNSKIQTPQGLFGGYAPCTIPGVSVAHADLMPRLAAGDTLDLDITEVLRARSIGGEWGNEFQGRAPRPYMQNDVITVAFATGGAGYGDPLERDPESVGDDIDKGLVSEWAAEHVYQVVWDSERRRVDAAATGQRRADERRARIARGRPYAEFEAEWLQRKPPEEILTWYGSWPDAKPLQPLMRP